MILQVVSEVKLAAFKKNMSVDERKIQVMLRELANQPCLTKLKKIILDNLTNEKETIDYYV